MHPSLIVVEYILYIISSYNVYLFVVTRVCCCNSTYSYCCSCNSSISFQFAATFSFILFFISFGLINKWLIQPCIVMRKIIKQVPICLLVFNCFLYKYTWCQPQYIVNIDTKKFLLKTFSERKRSRHFINFMTYPYIYSNYGNNVSLSMK